MLVRNHSRLLIAFLSAALAGSFEQAAAQESSLEARLLAEGNATLARAAKENGDAARGAIVFYQTHTACTKCHVVDGTQPGVGPDLTAPPAGTTDEHLVESLLEPSKIIRKGYELVTVATTDGRTLTGLVVEDTAERLVLRDPSQPGQLITIARNNIEKQAMSRTSAMPAGVVNQLASRQQFLDLVTYLIEIRDGGRARAAALAPPPALYTLQLPEYESHVDHAGILRDLDESALRRGKAIYEHLCINCHGTPEQPGSLPTSLRFASGKLKSGSDPYTMYQTLTRGFGLMAPQAWMVPQQKYDVIHYLRETYLQPLNATQYSPVSAEYLAGLPRGDTRGPAPRTIEPWVTMDYGPSLFNTYEIGSDGRNFAYKGIAVRLDPGSGGVSRGRAFMIFDHDTMRCAAAWTGSGFIDWNGIHFNGRHQVHPRVVGDVVLSNPTGPGWANPETGEFADDQRVLGRDGRRYGPLLRPWARYRGLFQHGDHAVIVYTVGTTEVLESPGAILPADAMPVAGAQPTTAVASLPTIFTRHLQLGPREKDLLLLVATHGSESPQLTTQGRAVRFGPPPSPRAEQATLRFDGASYAEIAGGSDFDMTGSDFTIMARLKTTAGGTIVAQTKADGNWVRNAKALFIRGGRLCYDIGWVGVVESKQKIDDGRSHDVSLRWSHSTGLAELFIDGQPTGSKVLMPAAKLKSSVLRLGYGAPDFPEKQTFFDGELRNVRFFGRTLRDSELATVDRATEGPVAHWPLEFQASDGSIADSSGPEHRGTWHGQPASAAHAPLLAGLAGDSRGCTWSAIGNRLCLKIPAGAGPLSLVLWTARDPGATPAAAIQAAVANANLELDLREFTHGGPPRWPQKLTTKPILGNDSGPFAVDVLTHPEQNPWLAQLRLTGLDFLSDGDRLLVCTWDGDVWLVSGLSSLAKAAAGPELTWQRIACGLFQPLGIRFVNGQIFVTCRDQLAILRDLNGDGETDFYECFNNDHQVTEHFHEFAMGLQTDSQGNFYYAKSARHALPAIVPHHGTLLRISADGARTDILATGFRAANGVCLNPDGSFVVTDQEGHWNPKNRINWVAPGKFYGNMFGYHDVTDASDAAMEQPLCWITNAFDRSPGELLWTPPGQWGPLAGSLLNLSYGMGKVFVVPFEDVQGHKQGGMCALPFPALPTGVMRGRFHPVDGQLYACGMFAWAGNAQQPGGLYRIRYTGRPMYLPIGLKARRENIELTFTDPLNRSDAADPANYTLKVWSLKRTENYGSEHYNEHPLPIDAVQVSADGRTVTLHVPAQEPTWGMEIVCRLTGADGTRQERLIHNSIFQLGD